MEDNLFTLKVKKTKNAKEIDLTRLPEPIDDTPKGLIGVYALEGNTLRVCLDLANENRPTELKTKPKTFQLLLVLERAERTQWEKLPQMPPVPPLNLNRSRQANGRAEGR